jgi:Na+/melibiose symporter-like transporter
MAGRLGVPELVIAIGFLVVYGGLVGVPATMICRRIGKPWWLGLLALVPIANVVLLWFVATSRWETSPPHTEGSP